MVAGGYKRRMAKTGWMALLITALFMSSPSSAPATPGDIVFEREGESQGFAPATFPHWVHRIRYRCYVCHSEIFEMKKGANKVTMEKINQGEFCGKCHNGKIAFHVEFQTCGRCHKAPTNTKP
jgi:c(7)-type cytochrome triheme protein